MQTSKRRQEPAPDGDVSAGKGTLRNQGITVFNSAGSFNPFRLFLCAHTMRVREEELSRIQFCNAIFLELRPILPEAVGAHLGGGGQMGMRMALSEQLERLLAVELLPPRAKLKLLWMAPRPMKWRLLRGLLTCASPQKVTNCSSPKNWHCTVGI